MTQSYPRFLSIILLLLISIFFTASSAWADRREILEMTFVTVDGSQHVVKLSGFEHEVIIPRDVASGLPTGKRQHRPVSVNKPVDKTSPLLMKILTQNENITEWRMNVYREFRKGSRKLVRSIILDDPSVCGIGHSYAAKQRTEQERVDFCYKSITWTWRDDDISSEDNWQLIDN